MTWKNQIKKEDSNWMLKTVEEIHNAVDDFTGVYSQLNEMLGFFEDKDFKVLGEIETLSEKVSDKFQVFEQEISRLKELIFEQVTQER